MKSKFAGLNFDSVEVLTQEEKKKVKGGYCQSGWQCNDPGWPTNGQLFGNYTVCMLACFRPDELSGGHGSCSYVSC